MTKPTILFVDDEPNILHGLKRSTRPKRNDWNLLFAGGGEQALEYFDQTHIDVLVADMRMPGIDGATLMERVTEISPGTMRIILSGESNVQQTFLTIGKSHRFLTKPHDPAELVAIIEKLIQRREEAAPEMRLLAESFFDRLTVREETFEALRVELEKDAPTPQSVAEIISQDANLAARVLQIVNSGYFGRAKETCSVCRATEILGLDRIRDILEAGRFGEIPVSKSRNTRSGTVHCPQHVAALAKEYTAQNDGDKSEQEMAYAMGLFCSLGHSDPDAGETAKSCNCSGAKSAVFGCSLLGLPNSLSDNLQLLTHKRPREVSLENCAKAISDTVLVHSKNPAEKSHANG